MTVLFVAIYNGFMFFILVPIFDIALVIVFFVFCSFIVDKDFSPLFSIALLFMPIVFYELYYVKFYFLLEVFSLLSYEDFIYEIASFFFNG